MYLKKQLDFSAEQQMTDIFNRAGNVAFSQSLMSTWIYRSIQELVRTGKGMQTLVCSLGSSVIGYEF